MDKYKLDEFPTGWIVGNFEPSVVRDERFEIGLKTFKSGDTEPSHFQRTAWELTLCISGKVRIGEQQISAGEILLVHPLEVADFECFEDAELVVIKSPSSPSDKQNQVKEN